MGCGLRYPLGFGLQLLAGLLIYDRGLKKRGTPSITIFNFIYDGSTCAILSSSIVRSMYA